MHQPAIQTLLPMPYNHNHAAHTHHPLSSRRYIGATVCGHISRLYSARVREIVQGFPLSSRVLAPRIVLLIGWIGGWMCDAGGMRVPSQRQDGGFRPRGVSGRWIG